MRVKRLFSIRAGILLCFLVTTQLLFGQSAYSSGTTYSAGQVSVYNNITYVSLVGSNLNHQPDTSATQWRWAIIIYEKDGTTQNGRPTTFGYVFKDGEICSGNYPQPNIVGQSVTSWQNDQVTHWASGCVKTATISFIIPTLGSGGSVPVYFTSQASRTSGGSGLTQAQMLAFTVTGGGTWNAKAIVNPAGGTAGTDCSGTHGCTVDYKQMITDTDPRVGSLGDCKNDVLLDGPVVTGVLTQDCSSTSVYDFGWNWNGSTMALSSGNPYKTNTSFASWHGAGEQRFYPSVNAVRHDMWLSLPWSGRRQDQLADITFQSGTSSTTRWSQVGARRLTDAQSSLDGTGVTKVVSASANFTSTDVGNPVLLCTSEVSPNCSYGWSKIASVTNSTTVLLTDNTNIVYDGSHNSQFYINLRGASTKQRKIFWSGTPIGHVNIDYNNGYLKSTTAIAPYDLTRKPPATSRDFNYHYVTSYTNWATTTDRCDIGSTGCVYAENNDFASNGEGAPMQMEENRYIYNMNAQTSYDGSNAGACGGEAAKSWQMLTGESGTCDGLSSADVAGGGGVWFQTGNIPIWSLESQTGASGQQSSGNSFYCATFAGKDTLASDTTCGTASGTVNIATGKPPSRYAHSDQSWPQLSNVGDVKPLPGGIAINDCSHVLDFTYHPYLLTGDYFYRETEYQWASYCINAPNNGQVNYGGNGIFGYANPQNAVLRILAWSLMVAHRADFIAPDSSFEQQYYHSMVLSNLEVQEGVRAKTGTTLTPASTDTTCASYPAKYLGRTMNRWDFGHCGIISVCTNAGCPNGAITPTLHMQEAGICPIAGDATSNVNPTNASTWGEPWYYGYLGFVTSQMRWMGLTEATYLSTDLQQGLEEKTLDSSFNPYLIGEYIGPERSAADGTACNGGGTTTDHYFTTYAGLLTGELVGKRTVANFGDNVTVGWNIDPCADHAYATIQRSLATYASLFNTSSTWAGCPGGVCTAAATKAWIDPQVPFFSTGVTGNCSLTPNDQIKWAMAFPAATVASCTFSPSSAAITTGGTQAYTSVITWSDSTTTDGTATLVLSSGTPSVATCTGQNCTGVSPGSSTITGTNTVSCGTSALTVNLNQGSLHTPGTIQTKGTVIR